MKRQIQLMLCMLALVACGCRTVTPGKILATTAVTADAAMQGWASYVSLGYATYQQETEVRKAYAQYQGSMKLATAAWRFYESTGEKDPWLAAAEGLQANQAALLALIAQFKGAK